MAGQTYPLAQPSMRLTIGSTDRTDELLARTLVVKQALGALVDTCSFTLKPKETYRGTAGSRPLNGIPVLVETKTGSGDWTRLFGGLISRVKQRRLAYQTRGWDVQVVDYSSHAGKVLVNETYAGQSVSAIANDICRRFVPYVSTSGIRTMDTIVERISFPRQYPNECFDRLARMVGWEWYVDTNRVLQFFDPVRHAPISTLEVTDDSDNFSDLSVEPRIDQLRNRVYVEGGVALSDEIQEIWDADGMRDVFGLQKQNIFASLTPLTTGNLASNFMRIDGAPQVVGEAGIIEDDGTANFLLDRQQGTVRNSKFEPTVPDGSRIIFRYRYAVPVVAVREDRPSQKAIAAAEGKDYPTVVTSGSPVHWWRMDETSGRTVANTATTFASGILIGTSFERRMSGPLSGDQGYSMEFWGGTRIQCYSGAQLPKTAYTLEAWVNARTGSTDEGILGQWDDRISDAGGLAGRGACIMLSGGTYQMRHFDLKFNSNRKPTGSGAFDHVVATWNGSQFRMFVNKQVSEIAPTSTATLELPAVSGIEIGNYNYGYGLDHTFQGRIAEPAVYPRALSPYEVAERYDAGRFAGIREAVVVDNELTSFDDADRYAREQLARWGNPLTDVRFSSFVSGWTVGERVNFNVSGIGVTFSGLALVQEIDYRWLGAQRAEFLIHCVGARLNLIDYFRSLSRVRDIVTDQASIINVVRPLSDRPSTIVAMGAAVATTHVGPPFYTQPDWGTGTDPAAKVGFSITDNINGGNPWF